MVQDNQFLTTREFASRAGIQASKVSKLIRDGKIEAEKKSGKWMIHPNQLQTKAVKGPGKGSIPKPKKITPKAPQKKTVAKAARSASPQKKAASLAGRAYTVSEFVEMTYLTEFGVRLWLKQGRLEGQQNEKGEWLIDAANLQVPGVKRLVREHKAP